MICFVDILNPKCHLVALTLHIILSNAYNIAYENVSTRVLLACNQRFVATKFHPVILDHNTLCFRYDLLRIF